MTRRGSWRARAKWCGPAIFAAAALNLAMAGPSAFGQQTAAPLGPTGGYNPLAPHMVAPEAPAPPEATDGMFEGLPETDGVELVYYLCSSCHSIRLVTQQRVTPARWDYLLDWMVKEHSMPELPPEDRTVVLAYLSRHFSAR